MGYFNPISYFLKSFIRIFTKKFFWIILLCLFLGFILFIVDKGVFAVSPYSFDDTYFSQTDIDTAKSYIGSTIWDNSDNDIYLYYAPGWVFSNNFNYGKAVAWFNTNNLSSDTKYIMHNQNESYTNSFGNYKLYYATALGSSSNSIDYHCTGIYQHNFNTNETRSGSSIFLHQASMSALSSNPNTIFIKPIRTHFDFVDENNNVIFSATNPRTINPHFITTQQELETFDFDYLQISGGTTPYMTGPSQDLQQRASFTLQYIYKGVTTNIDISNYITVHSDNTWSINIPYNVLTNNVIVRNGEEFSYRFYYQPYYGSGYDFLVGPYIYNLTTEQEQQINEDSDKQVQGEILEQQQQTNNKLDNLDNTISDSTVDDITDDTLPSDSTEDITSEGVNGIFTSIYNAFCTGEAQDIVFPIPFTNKNITLKANYVSNMLSSSNASWLIIIIQAFWWYLISRFIIKDVMNKINKIKSGNIEKIEETNIRGDML